MIFIFEAIVFTYVIGKYFLIIVLVIIISFIIKQRVDQMIVGKDTNKKREVCLCSMWKKLENALVVHIQKL